MSKFYVWIDNPSSQIETSQEFNLESQRIGGFLSGKTISSKIMNTILRQTSLITVAFMDALGISEEFDLTSSVSSLSSAISTKFDILKRLLTDTNNNVLSIGEPDKYQSNYAGESKYWLSNTIEGSNSFAFGRGLRQVGVDSIGNMIFGYLNRMLSNNRYCSILGGSQNVIQGSFSTIVGGAKNMIAATYCETGGTENVIKSYLGYSRGYKNYIGLDHTAITIFGRENTVPDKANGLYQHATTVLGQSNYLAYDGDGNFMSGFHLNVDSLIRTGSDNLNGRTFLGAFNRWNFKEHKDVILQVGNGTSNNNRTNAFEVMLDGRAKAYGSPKENNDVLRWQEKLELEEKIKEPEWKTATLSIGNIYGGEEDVEIVGNYYSIDLSADEGENIVNTYWVKGCIFARLPEYDTSRGVQIDFIATPNWEDLVEFGEYKFGFKVEGNKINIYTPGEDFIEQDWLFENSIIKYKKF